MELDWIVFVLFAENFIKSSEWQNRTECSVILLLQLLEHLIHRVQLQVVATHMLMRLLAHRGKNTGCLSSLYMTMSCVISLCYHKRPRLYPRSSMPVSARSMKCSFCWMQFNRCHLPNQATLLEIPVNRLTQWWEKKTQCEKHNKSTKCLWIFLIILI